MPDEAKFEKLREIGYEVRCVCGLCIHGNFGGEMKTDWGRYVTPWGTCDKHRYHHQKHDNPEEGRGVSIWRGGTCPDAEFDPERLAALGTHWEFMKGA